MSPRTGRPTDNPKQRRVEIRLTENEELLLNAAVKHFGTNKTEVLMRGLQLVELQISNVDFRELSNALIIRELQNPHALSEEDKQQIKNYIGFLIKRYE